jgi:hypothetical protein
MKPSRLILLPNPLWVNSARSALIGLTLGLIVLLTLLPVHGQNTDTGPVSGEPTRTQTIALNKGWNAAYLEVDPTDPDPAALFKGTPIDVAAAYFSATSVQFMTDPGEAVQKRGDWGVWYAPDRPEAFLGRLEQVYGQRAYLIHAKQNFSWVVSGAVRLPDHRWKPNAFNFTGFCVDATAAPTFSQFFSGSKAHRHDKIYRLAGEGWRRVTQPNAEAMRSGEAFWIYCDGGSTYQGPLSVKTGSYSGLVLGGASDSVVLKNLTDHPVTPTIEHIADGEKTVPLSVVLLGLNDERYGPRLPPTSAVYASKPDAGWTQDLPPIEAGRGFKVPFVVRREAMTKARQSSLLKITTDLGTEHWIPVTGIRK